MTSFAHVGLVAVFLLSSSGLGYSQASSHYLDEWETQNPGLRAVAADLKSAEKKHDASEFAKALDEAVKAGAQESLFEILRKGSDWSVSLAAQSLSKCHRDREVALTLLSKLESQSGTVLGGTESRLLRKKARSSVLAALAKVTGIFPAATTSENEQVEVFRTEIAKMQNKSDAAPLDRPTPKLLVLETPPSISRETNQKQSNLAEFQKPEETVSKLFLVVACLMALVLLIWKRAARRTQ